MFGAVVAKGLCPNIGQIFFKQHSFTLFHARGSLFRPERGQRAKPSSIRLKLVKGILCSRG